MEWILKLQTQHKKVFKHATFITKKNHHRIFLTGMLAKLHFMLLFFLIIIQPWAALKPSGLEFSFSFGGIISFVGSSISFKSS